jgi:adenylylsulfate reductase subunit A
VPYKFVSGCWAEGVIAARAAVRYAESREHGKINAAQIEREVDRVYAPLTRDKKTGKGARPRELEEELQKIMDRYAGGISEFYEMDEKRLALAREKLKELKDKTEHLIAEDLHELMLAHEVIDRIDVAQVLVEHLIFRKETRWPAYQTRLDYPERNDEGWLCFVNSKRDPETGKIEVFKVPYQQIVPGNRYKP